MYSLAQKGAYGPITTIPAGYHIEYSMLSGCLPLKHNVWTWYYMKKNSSFSKIKYIKPFLKLLNKKTQRKAIDIYVNLIRLLQGKTRFLKTNKIPVSLLEKFEIAVDKAYVDHNPLPVPTLFDELRKNNKKYIAMEFPTISDNKKTWLYTKRKDFDQLEKSRKLLEKYDIVFTHIWELDGLEHNYGLHSKQALNHIRKLDNKIKDIVLSQKQPIRVIIFSDHGGVNVTKTKDIVKTIKDYKCDYFIGSTTAQIWLKNQKDKQELKNKLEKQGFEVYDDKNIEKELFIPYKRDFVGDILACAKPGEQIFPDFFRDTAVVKSMHGYVAKTPELAGTFIMHGFNKKKKIKDMKLYDIAPTILKAMKLRIPKIWDGKARV